jgi:uncharacterized protein YukE
VDTTFSHLSRPLLAQLLLAGDPGAVSGYAEVWSDVARGLYSRAADLEQRLRDFSPYWTGEAASRYQAMIASLITGACRIADTARLLADNAYTAAEALRTAQSAMQEGAELAWVVFDLARRYADLEAALPAMPQVATPPQVTEVVSGTYRPADRPAVFGDLYGNGLATASAALGGRFQNGLATLLPPAPVAVPLRPPHAAVPLRPAVPPPANTPVPAVPPISAPMPPPASALNLSQGGAAVTPPEAIVPPIAAPPAPAPTPISASGNGMAGFYPPMFPMGMGGAAEGGAGGRQVPHWLTEPEPDEVFGVPLRAVMPIIGEGYDG